MKTTNAKKLKQNKTGWAEIDGENHGENEVGRKD